MAVIAHAATSGISYASEGVVTAFPEGADEITPSDTDTHEPPVTVYVGVTGNVAIVPAGEPASAAVVFKGLPAGSVVPCRAVKVMATGTTATDLVALY